MAYASTTKVQIADTREHIERLLRKHGAERFFYSDEPEKATIGFVLKTLLIRITVPYAVVSSKTFAVGSEAREAQTKRSRWRALLFVLKARFEAAEAGISTIEKEFLADTVMANKQTVNEWMRPQIVKMIASGEMPQTLMIEGPRP